MPNFPSSFADFLVATRDRKVTSKDTLLNEATKRTYFLGKMVKGRGEKATFKGGSKLVEKIQKAGNGSFGWYSPNDEENPQQTDTLKSVEVDWAFARTYYTFGDEETELNEGDPDAFIDLKRSYELSALVDGLNGIEESLWATPNADTMEAVGADPREMYSIPAFVTRDGLEPSTTNGGIASGSSTWTTIATINPGVDTWYQNQNNTYDSANPDDPDNGLVSAFDDMVLLTGFEMPEGLRMYSEDDGLQYYCIVTSRDGVNFFKSRMRQLSERNEMMRDPAIIGPQYQGVPIKYAAELDNAGWTTGQPDYFWLNLHFFFPFFHNRWYWKEKLTDGGSKQPTTYTMWKFIWMNLMCRSRRRQGRVSAA